MRTLAAAVAALVVSSAAANDMKFLVLGMDGVDPVLLQRLMDAGKMPNFSKVAAQGGFLPLETAMPPQSPVAWSNFIVGSHPGKHQIYDFIHRRIEDYGVVPYLSTSEIEAPKDMKYLYEFDDKWAIPREGGKIVSLRKGDAFWEYLVERGIDTTLYRIPATYPPPTVKGRGRFRCMCGMGTPDLNGSYGEFTCFAEGIEKSKDVAGGRFVKLTMVEHRASGDFLGPTNPFQRATKDFTPERLRAPVTFFRDPEDDCVLLRVGASEFLMRPGEWSPWVDVDFDTGVPQKWLVGMAFPTSLRGIVRFYVRSVHPELYVYASPLNIDPTAPANAVSEPLSFAADVADISGSKYYTTGIPEDTKGLREGGLTEDEFLEMVAGLTEERTRQYHAALNQFERGFLFFYFGHTDQLAHIFWRDIDPGHPGRLPEQEGKYAHVIDDAYLEMDVRVGEALEVLDDNDVLVIMSDHGFASFRRGLNVNTFLYEKGYLSIRSTSNSRRGTINNVEFAETEAYAIGINGLYINLAGRESLGIVPQDQKREKMEEIAAALLEIRDEDGAQVVEKVYITEDIYPGADPLVAPDMLIGFARNYRGSWDTALGGQPRKLIEDNKDRWSGDHCIAHYLVPGILVTNRRIAVDDPALVDVGPTILNAFGIPTPETMIGRDLFGGPAGGR